MPFASAVRTRSRRRWIGISVLGALLVALLITTVLVGETFYPLSDIIAVIAGQDVPGASFTVGRQRIPRALTGVLAGIAFGIAGTTFQTLLRNPLASPDMIGITSGASVAAVLSLVVLHLSAPLTLTLSLLMGVATAAAIYLAARGGESTGGRLILIGIGVGAMLDAVVFVSHPARGGVGCGGRHALVDRQPQRLPDGGHPSTGHRRGRADAPGPLPLAGSARS